MCVCLLKQQLVDIIMLTINKQNNLRCVSDWQLLLLHNAADFPISQFTSPRDPRWCLRWCPQLKSHPPMDSASFEPASTPHSPLHRTTNIAALRQSTLKTWRANMKKLVWCTCDWTRKRQNKKCRRWTHPRMLLQCLICETEQNTHVKIAGAQKPSKTIKKSTFIKQHK